MIELFTDWSYLLHRLSLIYGLVCYEAVTKHFTLAPQEKLDFDFNNQIVFIKNIDGWISVKSNNGEFNASNSELNQNITEHTGKTVIENIQPSVSQISGNIHLIIFTIKLNKN